MTLRQPMYLIINNVRYKTYESYSRRMCFYQENCSLKIFWVGFMRGVYYVHLERSNYPCGLCKRQVSNLGFIEVTSLL